MSETGSLPLSTDLALTNPLSLNDLFSKDPLKLTRQDRDKIVEVLRAQRAKYKQSADTANAVKAEKKPKAASIITRKALISAENLADASELDL